MSVFVRILDVNDNAPQFAVFYDTFVCENARPGQVSNSTTPIQEESVVCKMCFDQNLGKDETNGVRTFIYILIKSLESG